MSNRAIRTVIFVFGLALIFSCSALSTRAQDDNFRAKATKVTVNEPMQVPGTVLQPGEYVFRLNDSDSNRHIVEIYDKDKKLVTRILAIPNERLTATDKPIMTYQERPTGQPVALEAWFYSGETLGQQFAYPKSQAAELSRLNNTKVPSTDSEEAFPGENLSASAASPQSNVSSPSGSSTQTGTAGTSSTTGTTGAGASGTSSTGSTASSSPATSPNSTAGSTGASAGASTGTSGATRSTSGTGTAATSTRTSRGAGANSTSGSEQLPKTASQLPKIAFLGSVLVAFSLLLKVVAR